MDRLPTELVIDISEYLSVSDLKQMRLVCRKWRDLTYMPNIVKRFKFVITDFSAPLICEYMVNSKDALKLLAYTKLDLHYDRLTDNLQLVLKNLGPSVRNLRSFASNRLSFFNDCFPNLEELSLYLFSSISQEEALALNLSKFKNLKSLEIHNTEQVSFLKTHLLRSLICPPFKLNKLSVDFYTESDEDLVLQVLKYHGSSLTHLSITLQLKLASRWKEIFPLLRKLESISITSYTTEDLLLDLINGIPKEAPLRTYKFSSGRDVSDSMLKLIIDKWHKSLENIDLSSCNTLTADGVRYLRKLRHRIKSLDLSNSKVATVNNLLDGLAEETCPSLKKLLFNNTDSILFNPLVERFPELTYLNLYRCESSVDDQTLQCIFEHLRKLTNLRLQECSLVTDKGLIGFGPTPAPISNLKQLKVLSLVGSKNISDRALIQVFKFKELSMLYFGECPNITSAGIKELVKNCPVIRILHFTACPLVDDEAGLYIVRDLQRLRLLNLGNCNLITWRFLDYVAEYGKYLRNLHACGISPKQRPMFNIKIVNLMRERVVDREFEFCECEPEIEEPLQNERVRIKYNTTGVY